MEIVLATLNVHKIREIKDMLKGIPHLDILSLHHFPSYTPPAETGKTFEENAVQKALHAAKELGKWVLADDSGLVVPSLNGSPGIYSRRFAGEDATDSENRKKLLQMMKDMDGIGRSAHFECCLALASSEGLKRVVTGVVEGRILTEERGRNGFGYDPIFVKNDYEKTFSEMDETTKNRISHRRKAFDKIRAAIETVNR